MDTENEQVTQETAEELPEPPEGRTDDFALVDADAETPEQPEPPAPQEPLPESEAVKAERIRAAREAELAASARLDAEIAGMTGLKNPYTEKPFSSMQELREYNERVRKAELAEKAKETGRSVEELEEDEANRAFLTRMRKSAEAAPSQKEWFRQDLRRFLADHPGVDVEALDRNPQFRRFVGSRYGREPLSQLYGDYVALVGEAGTAAKARAERREARSTGGGSAGGAGLTAAQRRALNRWNEENPDMQMTAKEFLRR